MTISGKTEMVFCYALAITSIFQIEDWDFNLTPVHLVKSCKLVAQPITGFFIFKNTATVMQRQESRELQTRIDSGSSS